jgi:hypothetical protein
LFDVPKFALANLKFLRLYNNLNVKPPDFCLLLIDTHIGLAVPVRADNVGVATVSISAPTHLIALDKPDTLLYTNYF